MKLLNLCVIFLFLLCGCKQLQYLESHNKLTREEYIIFLENVRSYISSETSLSITDKEIINKNEPKFSVYYTSYKYGDFSIEWVLANDRILIVEGMGSLLGKKSLKKIIIQSREK